MCAAPGGSIGEAHLELKAEGRVKKCRVPPFILYYPPRFVVSYKMHTNVVVVVVVIAVAVIVVVVKVVVALTWTHRHSLPRGHKTGSRFCVRILALHCRVAVLFFEGTHFKVMLDEGCADSRRGGW